MAPANGTAERYQLQAALNYTASELHASFKFCSLGPDQKAAILDKVTKKLEYVSEYLLKDRSFLVGGKFSIADSFLFIVLGFTSFLNIDISPFPVVQDYLGRIGSLPVVKDALAKMATNPSRI